MSDWNGSLKELGKLQANLGKLGKVPSRAAGAAAERIADLILEEFSASTDPYGNAWEALEPATIERKGGDDTILVRSGDMLDSVEVAPMAGSGISITLEQYAAFHQGGTINMAQRQILPSDQMPATWAAAIEEEVSAAFDEVMGEF